MHIQKGVGLVIIIGQDSVELMSFMNGVGERASVRMFCVIFINFAGHMVIRAGLFFASREPTEGFIFVSYANIVRFPFQGFVIDGALFPHNSAFVFVRLRRCEPVVFNSTCSATFLVSSVIAITKLRVKREFFEERRVIWVVTVSPRKHFLAFRI